jgi:hypothetical protein
VESLLKLPEASIACLWCVNLSHNEKLFLRKVTPLTGPVETSGMPIDICREYVAINRRDAIQPAFDSLLGVVDEVLTVDQAIVERAKQIVFGHHHLSARDALHLAVMEHHGIEKILTFDSGFDGFPVVTRLL